MTKPGAPVEVSPLRQQVRLWLTLFVFVMVMSATEAFGAPGSTVKVWCVGSPSTRELPGICAYPLIAQQAQRIGYTIVIENIPAADFVAQFREAVQQDKAPEILMFNNFGVLIGVDTPTGHFEGLLEREPATATSLIMVYETLTPWQPGGWWTILVSSASNHDAARNMALQPLPCPAQSGLSRLPRSELANLSELAAQLGRAYVVGDKVSLAAASDEARLGNKTFLPKTKVTIEKLHICSVYGNERLAFVTLAATFLTPKRPTVPTQTRKSDYALWLANTPLGQQSLLAVFRKHQGQWRLLAISDDPVNTGYSGRATAAVLDRLTGLMATDQSLVSNRASLITPDSANVMPPPSVAFRHFDWISSQDAAMVCEVVEFLVGDTPFPRERTRLFFLFGREQRLTAGMTWGRGGRWRVWSINSSGDVALSESRAFRTH